MSRELREELDVDVVSVAAEAYRIEDHGSEFVIAFIPTVISGEPRALEHEKLTWADAHELTMLDLAPSDEAFVTHHLRSGTEE